MKKDTGAGYWMVDTGIRNRDGSLVYPQTPFLLSDSAILFGFCEKAGQYLGPVDGRTYRVFWCWNEKALDISVYPEGATGKSRAEDRRHGED